MEKLHQKLTIQDNGIGKVSIKIDDKEMNLADCNGYELIRQAGKFTVFKMNYILEKPSIEIKINSD